MKKILIILLFIICLPISVQATEVGKIGEKEEKEISNLYEYITKIKTKYEIFNDMEPRTFVQEFMKTGTGTQKTGEEKGHSGQDCVPML